MKIITPIVLLFLLAACQNDVSKTLNAQDTPGGDSVKTEAAVPKDTAMADAATIMARKQVPVLCYHNIIDGKSRNLYEVTLSEFRDQMKTLHDSGYTAILPDQLYNYLTKGATLPEKPVMITYDDTDEEQFSIAKFEMDKYKFKGVYFLMTISIGRPRYMSKEQIKQLADEGHAVECHTWDHHRVDRYTEEDWNKQVVAPREKIESITGKPVQYFAYPFGVWSPASIPPLKERGYKLAFQLSAKRDTLQPLHTVRRIIVAPGWSGKRLVSAMNQSFR